MTMFSLGVFRLSLRQLIGQHRRLLIAALIVLVAIPMLIALIEINSSESHQKTPRELFDELFNGMTLGFILPVIALILSATTLREEIQTQTINYLILKPISRMAITLSKWSAATLIALIFSAASILGLTLILKTANIEIFLAVGLMTTLAYASFYFFLSLAIDRVLIGGFVYLILWEGIIGNISKPASLLSIRYYAHSMEQALLGTNPAPDVSLGSSVMTLLAIAVLLLILAGWRLSRMEFPGSSD